MATPFYTDIDLKNQSLQNANIDADSNTVSNLDLTHFKSSVIESDPYSLSASPDSLLPASLVLQLIQDRRYDNISWRPAANLIFNDGLNPLPPTTATLIDGVTVTDGMRVLVLDSSTVGQIGKVFKAAVDTGNITWTVELDGTIDGSPSTPHTIWITSGTVYGGTRRTYTTSWVETFNLNSYAISVKKYAANISGTSGSIPATTHLISNSRDIIYQVQEDGSPNRPIMIDVTIASNGDVTWSSNVSITGRIILMA